MAEFTPLTKRHATDRHHFLIDAENYLLIGGGYRLIINEGLDAQWRASRKSVPPLQPTGFSGSDIGSGYTLLVCDTPDDDTITGYQYNEDGGDWIDVPQGDYQNTNIQIRFNVITDDSVLFYQLRAINNVGESPPVTFNK